MPQVRLEIFDTNIVTNEMTLLGSVDIAEHETFPLALSFSLADMKDITKRTGVASKSFKIPATKNNNQLLQYLYQVNNNVNAALSNKRAQVTVEGLPVFMGNLRIKDSVQTAQPEEYELELYGDNLDWVAAFRDASIRDLNFGNVACQVHLYDWNNCLHCSDCNHCLQNVSMSTSAHVFDRQHIEASWWTGYPHFDYVYSLKSYGTWRGGNVVTIEDMRPDIYLRSIIQKSFDNVGYTLQSSFLDSDDFKRLILPYAGSFKYPDAYAASKQFKAIERRTKPVEYVQIPATRSFLIEINDDNSGPDYFDRGGHYDSSLYCYTVTSQCMMRFSAQGEIITKCSKPDSNIAGLFVAIWDRTRNVPLAAEFFTEFTDNLTPGDSHLFFIDTGFIKVTPNTIVTVEATFFVASGSGIAQPTIIFPGGIEFFNEVSADIIEGNTYNVAAVLPAISQLDVVAGVMNMFNLYFRTDVINKIVYCEPRYQFYKQNTYAVDWSGKLDVSKDISIEFIDSYKRDLQFAYKEDGKDGYYKVQSQLAGKPVGSYNYPLPERFMPGKQEMGTKVFSYTLDTLDELICFQQSGKPLLPTFWTDDHPTEPSYDFGPHVLAYMGMVSQKDNGVNAGWKWIREDNGVHQVPFATARHVSTDTGVHVNLGYDDYLNEAGLVSKYYAADIATIEDGKIVTAWFYLRPTDIMNLDLSVPVYLDHPNLKGYYYINQLTDYQPQRTESTKVELLKVFGEGAGIGLHSYSGSEGSGEGGTGGTGTGNNTGVRNPRDKYTNGVSLGAGTGQLVAGGNMGASGTIGVFQASATDATVIVSPAAGAGVSLGAGQIPSRPSTVLHNSTGNFALEGSGSIAFGQGIISTGTNQTIMGRYNAPGETDMFQIGAGSSHYDRYRGLTFTGDGNFIVQGGYMYTSDGQEILFASQKNTQGKPTRFDKLHLKGNQ